MPTGRAAAHGGPQNSPLCIDRIDGPTKWLFCFAHRFWGRMGTEPMRTVSLPHVLWEFHALAARAINASEAT